MKKQLLLFSLLFTLLLSYSQEVAEPAPVDTTQQTEEAAFCPHRISTKIAIGPTNNVYRRMPTMDHKYSYSYAVEAGYTYFSMRTGDLALVWVYITFLPKVFLTSMVPLWF